MASVVLGSTQYDGVKGVKLNTSDGGTIQYGAGNWDQNSESGNGFIHNRPFYIESGSVSVSWDGQPTDFTIEDAYMISNNVPSGEDLSNGQAVVSVNGIEESWPIIGYYKNQSMLTTAMQNQTNKSVLFVADGRMMGFIAGALALLDGNEDILAYVIPDGFDTKIVPGIYAAIDQKTDETSGDTTTRFISKLNYCYSNIVADDRYKGVLKNRDEASVYVVDAGNTEITSIDFSNYSAGDVVLVIGAKVLAG